MRTLVTLLAFILVIGTVPMAIAQTTGPLVAEGLLRGDYDSGLTHVEHVEEHADKLRLDLDIGEIDTTWVVYGHEKRFKGEVIGIPSAELFGVTAAVA